MQEQILINELK